MDPEILTAGNFLLALILSLSVHEFSHAYVAKIGGDDTAQLQGRLTLNPLAHVDWLGTVILPIIMVATTGGLLGWAKPVPVDLRKLHNKRWGHMYVAAAGPLSNLILCFLFILLLTLYQGFSGSEGEASVIALLMPMIQINALLAFFNLIPLPPLDGGAVFSSFLPERLRSLYEDYVSPYGFFILAALLFSGSLGGVWQAAIFYMTFVSKGLDYALSPLF